MDADRKREFITELGNNIIKETLAQVDKMPDEWDGIELRQYLADRFRDASFTWSEQSRGRKRSYRNERWIRKPTMIAQFQPIQMGCDGSIKSRIRREKMPTIKQDVRDAIVEADGTPYVRPEWTNDSTIYSAGFYWENIDGDRFYFATREEAEIDLANDCGDD